MTPVERHIDSFSLRLESMPAVLLILLAVAVCALAWWYYRDPAPPISASMRRLLATLRATALVLLVFSLAEPVFRIVFTIAHTQRTAVLIDTSSSIAFPGDPERKRDAIEALAALRARLEIAASFFSFDSRIRPFRRVNPFEGEGTDIAAALGRASAWKMSPRSCGGDGRWNLGEDPASDTYSESVPVHAVLAGSPRTEPDVMLRGVSAPPAGRDGETVQVDVAVALTGRASGTMRVDILERGKTVAGGKAVLDGPGAVTVPVTLKVSASGSTLSRPWCRPRSPNGRRTTRARSPSACSRAPSPCSLSRPRRPGPCLHPPGG